MAVIEQLRRLRPFAAGMFVGLAFGILWQFRRARRKGRDALNLGRSEAPSDESALPHHLPVELPRHHGTGLPETHHGTLEHAATAPLPIEALANAGVVDTHLEPELRPVVGSVGTSVPENVSDVARSDELAAEPQAGESLAEEPSPPLFTPTTPARPPLFPEQTGGRRGPIGQQQPRQPRGNLRSELVCHLRGRSWQIAVELPSELATASVRAEQNGRELSRAQGFDHCWLFESPPETIWIRMKDGTEEKVSLRRPSLGGHLVFRLAGDEYGRLAKPSGAGSYLVVAPETWERDEEHSGPAPAEPEQTSIPGFRAHYFDLSRDQPHAITFKSENAEPITVDIDIPGVALSGDQIPDSMEGVGPLFCGDPPVLLAADLKFWDRVGSLVVDEEGRGRDRWRKAFSPRPNRLHQEFPPEFLGRKGGWFFVRVYDKSDDLLQGLDFRYLRELSGMKLPAFTPVPVGAFYDQVSVFIFHGARFSIRPRDEAMWSSKLLFRDDHTEVRVPPQPQFDSSEWYLGPTLGAQVRMLLLIERVWWCVRRTQGDVPSWFERPISFGEADFCATSDSELCIRLARRRWIESLCIGFTPDQARKYAVRSGENVVRIPLRDFESIIHHSCRERELEIQLWFEAQGMPFHATLGRLPAQSRVHVSPLHIAVHKKDERPQ